MVSMVHRICADTRSKAAGRCESFKALRQSRPCKSGESEGQTLYLQPPASNPLAGIPPRPAGFSFDFTNITSAIQIKLVSPDPANEIMKLPVMQAGILRCHKTVHPRKTMAPDMISGARAALHHKTLKAQSLPRPARGCGWCRYA